MEDIERLMDKGLPVDVRDQYGNTLLTIACQNGYVRGVEVESSSLLRVDRVDHSFDLFIL